MRRILYLLLLLLPLGLKAVETPDTLRLLRRILPDYAAVARLEYNRLEFPGSSAAFDSLYYRLAHLADDPNARLRILHMGGSHVQAGAFSGRMRANMQQFCSPLSVGRGVLFPFSVMGTNGPRDCTFTATGGWTRIRNTQLHPAQSLGLSGAALVTESPSSTLTFTTPQAFRNLVILGANVQDSLRQNPVLLLEGDTLRPFPSGPQEQGYEFELPRPAQTCTLAFEGDSLGRFSLRGILPDPYAQGLMYSESGTNGAAVASWLRCDEFQSELQLLSPDLVLLGIGINDANVPHFQAETFKASYRRLIQRIRQVNPHCALLFITNNDCYLRVPHHRRSINRNTALVQQAFRELAAEFDGALWDVYRIMGGYGSSRKWVHAQLMQRDHIHFTARGYNLLGDLLYNALVDDFTARGAALQP